MNTTERPDYTLHQSWWATREWCDGESGVQDTADAAREWAASHILGLHRGRLADLVAP